MDWNHKSRRDPSTFMTGINQPSQRDRNRDMRPTQMAVSPSHGLLVITNPSLPLYHIQKSLFATKFFKRKYWANHVKLS